MKKDNYNTVCEEFGEVWTFEEENNGEKEASDWLDGEKFTFLFVDGNHENNEGK